MKKFDIKQERAEFEQQARLHYLDLRRASDGWTYMSPYVQKLWDEFDGDLAATIKYVGEEEELLLDNVVLAGVDRYNIARRSWSHGLMWGMMLGWMILAGGVSCILSLTSSHIELVSDNKDGSAN